MRILGSALLLLTLFVGCLTPAGTDLGAGERLGAALGVVVDAAALVGHHKFRDRETSAAIDPNDALHVAVFHNVSPKPPVAPATDALTATWTPGIITNSLAVSHDGGQTWTESFLPYTGTAAPTSKWNLYCAHGDPNVFFDKASVIHIVTISVSCGPPPLGLANGISHATTRDDGKTWSEPDLAHFLPGNAAVSFNDREWTAYDPLTGRIGIVWTQFYAAFNRVALSAVFSSDGGHTWSTIPEELEVLFPITETHNYHVHAVWDGQGRFHVSGSACQTGGSPLEGSESGLCLVHFVGKPGGPWVRTDIPRSTCPGLAPSSIFWYAASAIDAKTGRVALVGDVIAGRGPGGTYKAAGGCLFVSPNGGATWSPGVYLGPSSAHPWVALTPQGHIAATYLEMVGDQATPTMDLFDPVTLALESRHVLGPTYDADTNNDGYLEYGDYDEFAASGGRFLWALTQPNQEGRVAPSGFGSVGFNDLDVIGYRGTFPASR